MKILIICNNSSGLFRFRAKLIENFINKQNEVIAVVPKPKDEVELYDIKRLEGISCRLLYADVDRRGLNPFKDLILIKNYTSIIKSENPDMVITYTIKPNIYAGIICRILRIPYYTNITGLGTAFQKNLLLVRFVTYLYEIALKRAQIIFFENVENEKIFIEKGIIDAERSCVLPGAGVDLEVFKYQNYPKYDKRTRFLFIGRVMKEKGIDELLEAMRMLILDGYNCSLDIVGGLEENYKVVIDKYEKEGWLSYHGTQKNVIPFIKNCHCFVLPSWHEGMANTNLENAACGRPIITTNIHGCLESVEDGISGYLVQKQSSLDLYCAMKKFIDLNYEQRKHMGVQARIRVEVLFDKKLVVEKTISKILD